MRGTNNDTHKDSKRYSDETAGAVALGKAADAGNSLKVSDMIVSRSANSSSEVVAEEGVPGRAAYRARRRAARRSAARAAKQEAKATALHIDGSANDTLPSVASGALVSDTKCSGECGFTNGKSAVGRFAPTIAKEDVATLPPITFAGEIVVVDTPETIDSACDELLACSVVGFDTESRPSFQKGAVNRISLLQLSTSDKCFLFRLNKIRLDKAILKILESPYPIKVGLSVAGDIRELHTLRRFDPCGFVDLQKIAPMHGITDQSLVRIAAITLGRRLSKAQRLSNWEAVALTDAQKIYAATDAWICTEIYRKLSGKKI